MNIRFMTKKDVDGADQVLRRGHGMDVSFAPLLLRNLRLTPEWWWVIDQDGAITGVVGATDFSTFAHVGLLAVDPSGQRAGAGRSLMETLLNTVRERRDTVTLYSTDAGLRLYDKLGFRWEGLSTEWEFEGRLPTPNLHGRSATITRDYERLSELDRPWFGGDRRHLFALLETESPGRILLCDDDQGTGFLFAQGARLMGPFAASDPATAELLLATGLEQFSFSGGAPRVLLPDANPTSETLMIRCGFKPVRTSRFLVKGPAPSWRRTCLYGQAAYSLG